MDRNLRAPRPAGDGAPSPVNAGKYLTFVLGSESYGIDIMKVQEIVGFMTITRVPRTPDFIRGVINLRGKVIPVIDLRLRFGMSAIATTGRTCVIVVRLYQNDSPVTMALIVDAVSEVLDIRADQIEESPSFGENVNTDYIMGMGKCGDKVIMLLDIDWVLSREEVTAVARVAN